MSTQQKNRQKSQRHMRCLLSLHSMRSIRFRALPVGPRRDVRQAGWIVWVFRNRVLVSLLAAGPLCVALFEFAADGGVGPWLGQWWEQVALLTIADLCPGGSRARSWREAHRAVGVRLAVLGLVALLGKEAGEEARHCVCVDGLEGDSGSVDGSEW